ncbi:LZTR1 [Symbiodinium sp. CCMP2592]|nr:LZTR1 [Symbiodinium sp. CCMP2592]
MEWSSLQQARSQNEDATELGKEAVSEIARSYVESLTHGLVRSSIQAQGETAAAHEEAEYSLTDRNHLQNFLVEANIRPVRLEYLFKLADCGRIWPRRQEAEGEEFEDEDGTMRTALVTMEELQDPKIARFEVNPAILSVSHVWESQQHPDPWGWQLRSLLGFVESNFGSREKLKFFAEHVRVHYWVFIDFVCLHQYKRSEEEQQFFGRAMRSMHLLYAHRHIGHVIRLEELTPESEKSLEGSIDMYCEATGKFEARPLSDLVLNSTPYSERGWCVAEVQWMSTKDEVFGCSPMPPAVFQERVARGEQGLANGLRLKFTHRSDAKLVSRLQEDVFLQHARQRKRLDAMSLPQCEVSILAAALPHFVNLELLTISSDEEDFGHSILELAHGLERLCPQKLRVLQVMGDGITDADAAALATAAISCKELSKLGIQSDIIGDAGAEALAAAVLDCEKLTEFALDGCYRIADTGVAALAAASFAAPRVKFAMGGHVSQLANRLHHKWGNRTCGVNWDCPPGFARFV